MVLDWISAKPEKNIAAGANYVYWCGRVPDHTAVTLPEPRNDHEDPELDHYRWLRGAELEGYCAPYQARRVRAALQARVHGTLMELRHGHPLYEEAV
ncbi:hypothetical protein DQ392_01935 [Streptomyces reniochalinae]|uniref:NUDIX hydrolase n=1 Tax=Streptomyces reniochalinae TaxID=2250578 RepID=A0A367F4J2_9ACTN|nr:hypothetical protein DQ392_01935 [Streptomyces reniochalinae]